LKHNEENYSITHSSQKFYWTARLWPWAICVSWNLENDTARRH